MRCSFLGDIEMNDANTGVVDISRVRLEITWKGEDGEWLPMEEHLRRLDERGLVPLGADALDAFLEDPSVIPEDWAFISSSTNDEGTGHILFLGTRFTNPFFEGDSFYRVLYRTYGRWVSREVCVNKLLVGFYMPTAVVQKMNQIRPSAKV